MSDYIERRKAAELLCRLICGCERELCVSTYENCRQKRMLELYEIPSANVREDVNGTWIDKGYEGDSYWQIDGCGNFWHVYECSICGNRLCGYPKTSYCSSCGAQMVGNND